MEEKLEVEIVERSGNRCVKTVTFKMDCAELEILDTYARLNGMSRSEVIRLAIRMLIKGRPLREVKP